MKKQFKILITDDSVLSRNKLKKTLTSFENIEISEAKDGLEALQKISTENFDCIILDILMPNMNGIEVLHELNKKGVKIPVIFVSADIQQTTQKKCMELGALSVLAKPFDEPKLLQIIQTLSL